MPFFCFLFLGKQKEKGVGGGRNPRFFNGRLTAEVEGEIETENRMPIIRRIRVTLLSQGAETARETAERVHRVHHHSCPVYMSLHKAIDIRTELQLEAE